MRCIRPSCTMPCLLDFEIVQLPRNSSACARGARASDVTSMENATMKRRETVMGLLLRRSEDVGVLERDQLPEGEILESVRTHLGDELGRHVRGARHDEFLDAELEARGLELAAQLGSHVVYLHGDELVGVGREARGTHLAHV